MLNLHTFYRRFEDAEKDDRFSPINTPVEPTSIFVIFKQLQQVRAQIRYFEERESHLLSLAELGFKQIEERNKKNKE